MRFKIRLCFDVFANSVSKSCIDDVPLVRHFSRRVAQHLVNQISILLRLCALVLRPADNVAALLSPALLVRYAADNTEKQPCFRKCNVVCLYRVCK